MTAHPPSEPDSAPTTATISSELASKLERLRAILRDLGSLLVCYSGGLDSAFLLAVAHGELGPRCLALTAISPSLADQEHAEARSFAAGIGARHRLETTHELDREGYRANGPDRCFHCKSELYAVAEGVREAEGLAAIANGTNLDDLGDYRPGLDAARDAQVRSPLLEVGLRKAEIRELARHLGLRLWDKPAAACLSSRLPYGTEVTVERLRQIEAFEAALRSLGFRQLRVRWHDQLARVELALEELPRATEPGIREQLLAAGKAAGFHFITLDLGGYRVGSHNELLPGKRLRVS